MGTLLISYVILNVVIGFAVVAHHDYTQWKNRETPRAPNSAMTMPWLPLTVGYDNSCNPHWNKYYPPAAMLDDDFYDELDNGVVTIYYYNCGNRQTRKITSNYRFRADDVEFSTMEDSDGKRGTSGVVYEENRVKSGEAICKCIRGWHSQNIANPNAKSEVAAEWREKCDV